MEVKRLGDKKKFGLTSNFPGNSFSFLLPIPCGDHVSVEKIKQTNEANALQSYFNIPSTVTLHLQMLRI